MEHKQQDVMELMLACSADVFRVFKDRAHLSKFAAMLVYKMRVGKKGRYNCFFPSLPPSPGTLLLT